MFYVMKSIWKQGRFAMLAMGALPLYSLTNVFWMAQFGTVEMAATAIFFPLLLLFAASGTLWGMGGNILQQRYRSQTDSPEPARIVNTTWIGGTLTLLALLASGELLLTYLLPLLGATVETTTLASAYGRIYIVAAFLHGWNLLMQNILSGKGLANSATRIMTVTLLLGTLLSPLPIFIFSAGPLGAAKVFFAVSLLGTVLLLWQLRQARLLPDSLTAIDIVTVKQLLSIGWRPFSLQGMGALVLAVTNCVVAWYGLIPVAAVSVVMRHVALVTMLTLGLSKGYAKLLASHLQQGNQQSARKLTRTAMVTMSLLVIMLGTGIMFASPAIIAAFIDIPQAISFASVGMKLVFASVLLAGIDSVITHHFQLTGKSKRLFAPRFILQGLLYFPLMPVFIAYGGILGIPAAIMATKMLSTLGSLYVWCKNR